MILSLRDLRCHPGWGKIGECECAITSIRIRPYIPAMNSTAHTVGASTPSPSVTRPLTPKQVLHRSSEKIEHIYFPGGGMCSLVTVLEEGEMTEVATIGVEGVVGTAAIFDGGVTPGRQTDRSVLV
jgi:hypothetical protein